MRHIHSIILTALLILLTFALPVSAGILDGLDGVGNIQNVSIEVANSGNTDPIVASRDFGFKILTAFRLVVSGFALIYLVLVGAYMVVFSESEDKIKSQKNQITYALVGFLFLNMPGLVYTAFFGTTTTGTPNLGGRVIGDEGTVDFWDAASLTGLNGIIPMLIGFFEIFIFGIAIVLFTWGFFRLILSGGDEEVQKQAKNRILYGVLGLIFLGFVRFWGSLIAKGDFFGEFGTVGYKFLGLALYFAAPVVIFFLVIGAYYYITSAGDEERTKKAKAIFINTLIASLILLGTYSFLSELAAFTL